MGARQSMVIVITPEVKTSSSMLHGSALSPLLFVI